MQEVEKENHVTRIVPHGIRMRFAAIVGAIAILGGLLVERPPPARIRQWISARWKAP